LSRGFHEVYLGFYVVPLDDGYFFYENTQPYDFGATKAKKVLEMYQRWSVGARGAGVVAYR
jgi:hypothetical protein